MVTPLVAGALVVAAAAVLFFRYYRIWPLYYVLGAAFFTLFAVYLLRHSPVERFVEEQTALAAHVISGPLGVVTRIFRNAPGTILVLIVGQKVGWTVIKIDIECSGFLEMMVFTGLCLFYPGFSPLQRVAWLAGGNVITFLVNLIRVVVIVVCLHYGGKDIIYVAHTIIGRGLFFALVVVMYWYAFTRTTLGRVARAVVQK